MTSFFGGELGLGDLRGQTLAIHRVSVWYATATCRLSCPTRRVLKSSMALRTSHLYYIYTPWDLWYYTKVMLIFSVDM